MRAWAVVLGMGVCVACQPTERLSLPALGDSQTALLLVRSNGRVREAYALGPGDSWPALGLQEGIDLLVGTYSQSLSDLGIPPGLLNLEDVSAPVAPTPIEELILAPPYQRWAPSDQVDPLWSELKIQRIQERCLNLGKLTKTSVQIPNSTAEGACWITAEGDRGVWIGNASGIWDADVRTFVQRLGGEAAPTPGLTVTATTPVLVGRGGVGGGYLLQRGGKLSLGDFDNGFTLEAQLPSSPEATAAWITGPQVIAHSDVYVLDNEGGLWRWANGQVSTLLEPDPSAFGHDGALVWLGFGDVVVMGPRGGQILRVNDDQVESLALPGQAIPRMLTGTQRNGIIAGDTAGQLYRLSNDVWVPLPDAPRVRELAIAFSYADGLLYGPESGLMTYYSEEQQGCTDELLLDRTPFAGFEYEGVAIVLSSSGIYGDAGPITLITLER